MGFLATGRTGAAGVGGFTGAGIVVGVGAGDGDAEDVDGPGVLAEDEAAPWSFARRLRRI